MLYLLAILTHVLRLEHELSIRQQLAVWYSKKKVKELSFFLPLLFYLSYYHYYLSMNASHRMELLVDFHKPSNRTRRDPPSDMSLRISKTGEW